MNKDRVGKWIPKMQSQINDDNKKVLGEKREIDKVVTEIVGDKKPDQSKENKKRLQPTREN